MITLHKEDNYQQCTRCVMDTTADDIFFDKNGVCSFCIEFLERSKHIIFEDRIAKEKRLNDLVLRVKASGKGKPYDCILGVSGGVDSSWALVEAKRLGLRPLAVHMDNGWNSELAQNNISSLIQSLGVDLYTHVIDWDEYRNLMQAFFDTDVIDLELLYDNAMLAVNYQVASKYGLKYILAGTNQVTEGMRMPSNWNWFKFDKRNIKAIAKHNKINGLKTFPSLGTLDLLWYKYIRRIEWTSFLDFLPFCKSNALNDLEKNYGYKRYPFKHYESVFTRFYQGYILPNKFNVDKRKLHLSTLVISNQISREEAIIGLSGIPYPSTMELESDILYFLKKMNWDNSELDHYISRPEVLHSNFHSEKVLFQFLMKIREKI
jgi:N-acetyl sugar amidotransferase